MAGLSFRGRIKAALYLFPVVIILSVMFQNFSSSTLAERTGQPERATKKHFVWPMDGWIQATDHYRDGKYHGAVADISATHFTPVFAARAGRVSAVYKSVKGGNGVYISHDGGYRSVYTHLAEAVVTRGDSVQQGQLIGYNGRLGNAMSPHLHFSILKDEKVVTVPNLQRGHWVRAGSAIPLGVVDVPAQTGLKTQYTVKALERLATAEVAGRKETSGHFMIPDGREYVVVGSYHGFLRIRMENGELQYVPRNMVALSHSLASSVRTREPATLYEARGNHRYAELSSGFFLTRYQDPECEDQVFACVLFRRTGDPQVDLRRVPFSQIETSPTSFVTFIYSKSTPFRSGPHYSLRLIRRIIDPAQMGAVRVLDVRNGYYKVKIDGEVGWVPGWHTGGPR